MIDAPPLVLWPCQQTEVGDVAGHLVVLDDALPRKTCRGSGRRCSITCLPAARRAHDEDTFGGVAPAYQTKLPTLPARWSFEVTLR